MEIDENNLIHPEDYINQHGYEAFVEYQQAIEKKYVEVGILADAEFEQGHGVHLLIERESKLEQWLDTARDYFEPDDNGRDDPHYNP